MTSSHFDQASRYAAKLDPLGFLRWLMRRPALTVIFDGWLDTRTIPFPGEPDRICDTVAGLTDPTAPKVRWAMPVEFQTRAQGNMFGRLLEYLARLWIELRPPGMPNGHYRLVAGIVNLTGMGRTSRDMELGQTGLRTCLHVAERNLAKEDAAATLQGITDGTITRCILPWIPLMRGGAEAGIIDRWKELARAEPDSRRRSDYAGLALVFADLAKCWDTWKQALEGWNVEQSQQVLEWQAVAAKRARAEGLAEGLALAEAKVKADDLVLILRTRLTTKLPTKLEHLIRKTNDINLLNQWMEMALTANSLKEIQQFMNDSSASS